MDIQFSLFIIKFQQVGNASEACRNLVKAFDEVTFSDRMSRIWLEKFQIDNFDLSNKPRSKPRSSLIDGHVVNIELEQNPFFATSEIEERLDSPQKTFSTCTRELAFCFILNTDRIPR